LYDYLRFSPSHDLWDYKQIYINTSRFWHAVDEGKSASLIGPDCAVRTEYLHL